MSKFYDICEAAINAAILAAWAWSIICHLVQP